MCIISVIVVHFNSLQFIDMILDCNLWITGGDFPHEPVCFHRVSSDICEMYLEG